MWWLRRRLAALLVLCMVALIALATLSQGMSDARPILWHIANKHITEVGKTEATLEAEGGSLHRTLHQDEGAADVAVGATIELYCRQVRGEWKCSGDSYGARMGKIGGGLALALVLLGLVLSPEIRERFGKS